MRTIVIRRLFRFFLVEIRFFDVWGPSFGRLGRGYHFWFLGLEFSFFVWSSFRFRRGLGSLFLGCLNPISFDVNLFPSAFAETVQTLGIQGLRTGIARIRIMRDFYPINESIPIAIGE